MATVNDRVGLLSWEMDLELTKFTGSVKDGVRSLSNLDKKGNEANKNLSRGFGRSTVAAGLFTVSLTALARESIEVAKAYDKIDNSMRTVFGPQAAAQMDFVNATAEKLGLSIRTAGEEYAKLAAASRGTAIEGKGVKTVFLGVSEAVTALGLSSDEAAGAFRAINQIISKGKVQAEELRGQLGERIPGAFQIAARAMGVTTMELDKMMESGELLSEDFIPKFSAQLRNEFGGAAKDAANSIQANTNRMKNAWEGAIKGMGKIAADFFPLVTKGLNQFSTGIEELIAQRNRLLGIGEFDPAADEFFKQAATREDILAAMTPRQRERMRLAKMTKEERQAELEAVKKQAAEEKRIKGLKSFDEFALAQQRAQQADKIAKAAGLTLDEFSAMKPAIMDALKEGVKFNDIIQRAKDNAELFGDALKKSVKSSLSDVKADLKGIFAGLDAEHNQINAKMDADRKARIDAIKAQMSSLDPRTTATRATAGTLAEFRLLNDAQREKEIAKNTKRMADAVEKLEAV